MISGFAVAAAIWAELLGVPAAWLRLRKSRAWAERPPGARRIDLLAAFVSTYTFLAAVFGAIVGIMAWVGAIAS